MSVVHADDRPKSTPPSSRRDAAQSVDNNRIVSNPTSPVADSTPSAMLTMRDRQVRTPDEARTTMTLRQWPPTTLSTTISQKIVLRRTREPATSGQRPVESGIEAVKRPDKTANAANFVLEAATVQKTVVTKPPPKRRRLVREVGFATRPPPPPTEPVVVTPRKPYPRASVVVRPPSQAKSLPRPGEIKIIPATAGSGSGYGASDPAKPHRMKPTTSGSIKPPKPNSLILGPAQTATRLAWNNKNVNSSNFQRGLIRTEAGLQFAQRKTMPPKNKDRVEVYLGRGATQPKTNDRVDLYFGRKALRTGCRIMSCFAVCLLLFVGVFLLSLFLSYSSPSPF